MTLIHADCLEAMAGMEPESVDAVCTDPPYGLGFMGKHWDHGVPNVDFWRAMFRVARPSSYLLSFGGTRTVHRIATNIEDAGWIIRDMLVWAYASGFPKSKASLKPAWEPIVMARKPGPLRDLAIDACRIPVDPTDPVNTATWTSRPNRVYGAQTYADGERLPAKPDGGRWPANVILTDPIFDGGWEGVVGGGETAVAKVWGPSSGELDATSFSLTRPAGESPFVYGDSGTYSRFFLVPKADRAEREPIMSDLVAKREMAHRRTGPMDTPYLRGETYRLNHHPTVKPVDLMRHLVRLVTPPGGLVLDPFLGSGTTAIAAEMEGFPWIGIEREAEYVAIAEARLNGVQRGFGLAV